LLLNEHDLKLVAALPALSGVLFFLDVELIGICSKKIRQLHLARSCLVNRGWLCSEKGFASAGCRLLKMAPALMGSARDLGG